MQTTIYVSEEQEYLMKKLEEKAARERKSKSATLLTIVEEFFESELRVGEILRDIGDLSKGELEEALEVQRGEAREKLGRILVEEGYVRENELGRALSIQGNGAASS